MHNAEYISIKNKGVSYTILGQSKYYIIISYYECRLEQLAGNAVASKKGNIDYKLSMT